MPREFVKQEAPAVEPALPRWRLLTAQGATNLAGAMLAITLVVLPMGLLVRGAGGEVIPAIVVYMLGLVFVQIFAGLHVFPDGDTRRWLLALIRLGFTLRLLLALAIFIGPWDRNMFSEDQSGYDRIPRLIASSWAGDSPGLLIVDSGTIRSRIGYFNFVALQFYIFGSSLMVPRIINCLGGALITLYVFYLALHVFGHSTARVAALWATLFPSLMLWSAINIRDIWLALAVTVIIRHVLLLRDRLTLTSLMVVVGNLAWIHFVRDYLVLILVASVIAAFAAARARKFSRDIVVGIILAVALFGLMQFFGFGEEGLEWLDLDKIADRREVFARRDVGASGYLPSLEIRNPVALAAALPLLMVYFLFSPFPWQMTVLRRILTAPEMAFWYYLAPSLFRAFRAVFRDRAKRQFALLLSLAVVTIAFAIPTANVGLAYRYRAQIIPLFLPFAAAGFLRRRLTIVNRSAPS